MSRFFTCHWQNRYWNPGSNTPNVAITAAGSNKFTERGACGGRGHFVYIVTIIGGQLYLGGRMGISRIVSRQEAVEITCSNRLYDASEWVIDDEGGTRLHLHRRLAPQVTRNLWCIMASGEQKQLCFVDDDNLDVQATRGVRELTTKSAQDLDRIIAVTDAMPRDGRLLTVTLSMLGEMPAG